MSATVPPEPADEPAQAVPEAPEAHPAPLAYLHGYGNELFSEALPETLPRRQNSPQRPARGLYAEQLSGSAFTMPRGENLRTWMYRIRPSVVHGSYERIGNKKIRSAPLDGRAADPNQLRWNPLGYPDVERTWLEGLTTMAVCGSVEAMTGCAAHLYAANASMERTAFYNADGHLLILPQEGGLRVQTELGVLEVAPGEIAVVPRGMKFRVMLLEERARGYVCENYGAPFVLPSLGPIGSNGLASARHFQAPVAAFEDDDGDWDLVAKFQGNLWEADLGHSPFDVVAWHGNYLPFKYDLADFQAVNSVDFDHSDPSIFTVLTSPTPTPGLANVDFVIFPPRWLVAEHTFRPPYYHRNVMSEFMGLIKGVYDAKGAGSGGFVPGGSSLHNCMTPHGPDAAAFEAATEAELEPVFMGETLAFMFETRLPFHPTQFALGPNILQEDYLACWQGLKRRFEG